MADDLEALVAPIGVEVAVPGAEPVPGVPAAPPAAVREKDPSRLALWIGLGAAFAVADIAILTWVLRRRRTSQTH